MSAPERHAFLQALDHMLRGGRIRRLKWQNPKFSLSKTSQFVLTEDDVFAKDWVLL